MDSRVGEHLSLNTTLVFTALMTVLLEYLTGYLESLNDYPVTFHLHYCHSMQDIL